HTPLPGAQPQRRLTRHAADKNAIAGTRATAQQRATGRHFASYLDTDLQFAAHRITTHQHNAALFRQRVEAFAKSLQPAFISDRQGKTEQTPARTGAHRGKIDRKSVV